MASEASKCTFASQQISYLGHVISKYGVATHPSKIVVVTNWPTPKNAKELRSFLGLEGYYRKFVKKFGVISKSLIGLLKKHVLFVWTFEHDAAFHALKAALTQAPVLAVPIFFKLFTIETEACDSGVGAMQSGHPLAYISKALGPKTKGLSTYDKEYLAILTAVDQWCPCLQHGEFIISTD